MHSECILDFNTYFVLMAVGARKSSFLHSIVSTQTFWHIFWLIFIWQSMILTSIIIERICNRIVFHFYINESNLELVTIYWLITSVLFFALMSSEIRFKMLFLLRVFFNRLFLPKNLKNNSITRDFWIKVAVNFTSLWTKINLKCVEKQAVWFLKC